jgi:DMSO reductase family type II enzyme molybdopterin subunit
MTRLNLQTHHLKCKDDSSLPEASDYDLAQVRNAFWDWDKVTKGSHPRGCAWQQFCSFNVFTKDGILLREEQVAGYPARNDPVVPDLNPRGCQKGASFVRRIYAPDRLKYPLERVGERGEGKWRRISWDEALTKIADTIVDVLVKEGPEAVVNSIGTGAGQGYAAYALAGFFNTLGAPLPAQTSEIGDFWPGTALTFGKIYLGDSADNWFHADVILIWGGNPAFTHIPNFHYLAEARYHGAEIIVISPDANASTVHADLWVPLNPGSDAALALSLAQVIMSEGLHREEFLKEQTDLPLLVRQDNGKFLREQDLKRGGGDDVFYFYDLKSQRMVDAPRRSLALEGMLPALDGEYEVQTRQGKIKVTPVMAMLRQKLDREYTPEQVSPLCGVSPALIRRLARKIAQAKGVVNTSTSIWGKYYHGDLIERAMILVFALCGHIGRKGASFNAFPVLSLDTEVGTMMRRGGQVMLSAASADPRYATWKEQGLTQEMILYEYAQEGFGALTPMSLFYQIHGGMLKLNEENNSWDPGLKRSLSDYIRESREKGWQFQGRALAVEPKIIFAVGSDMFRRVRGTKHLLQNLLPKLKQLVTIDWRMSATALYSDVVLPAATWYEGTAVLLTARPVTPYLHVNDQAAEPLYEAKTEWEIFVLLIRKIEERAKQRGLATFVDAKKNERRFDQLENKMTAGGLYAEDGTEDLARDIFYNATNVEVTDWEEFKQRGITPFTGIGNVGGPMGSLGNACDLKEGEPMVPLVWHTEKKQPYPTRTRRIQFYIDHDWFLELGEALPTHKDSPRAGGDYPIQLTGGHARWSIHSDWIDDAMILRLQRGQPLAFMSQKDARARDIQDGDEVELRNDLTSFRIQAVVSPSIRSGQVIIYHPWINYQFPGWKHFKGVMPSPLNPTLLAGSSGNETHLKARADAFHPGNNDRDTRVEIRRSENRV